MVHTGLAHLVLPSGHLAETGQVIAVGKDWSGRAVYVLAEHLEQYTEMVALKDRVERKLQERRTAAKAAIDEIVPPTGRGARVELELEQVERLLDLVQRVST
jgi:hypothetical protein